LGSEAEGLGERWQSIDSTPITGIHLPMNGKVDSLNISVSAAVLAFEALRQRQK
jgi:TrmH family RNA methyltransferase